MLEREVVATLTKPLVLATLVLGLALLAAPRLLGNAPDVRGAFDLDGSGPRETQSASQISEGEFAEGDVVRVDVGEDGELTFEKAQAAEPAAA